MRSFALLSLFVVAEVAFAAETKVEKVFTGVKSLNVTSLEGRTEMINSGATELKVTVEKVDFSKKCTLSMNQKADQVEITISKGVLLSSGVTCKANLRLEVPSGVKVEAFQATGSLEVTGLKDTVVMKAAAADLSATDLLSDEALLESTSGDVRLKYSGSNAPKTLKVKTTSGTAYYEASAPTRLSFKSLSGSQKVEGKPVDAKAASKVDFSSVSGSFVWK